MNWRPWARSVIQTPTAWMNSPAEIEATWPTTGTRSRLPRAFTFSTAKPLSSLWKVTRSTEPTSVSLGGVASKDGGKLSEPLTRQREGILNRYLVARDHSLRQPSRTTTKKEKDEKRRFRMPARRRKGSSLCSRAKARPCPAGRDAGRGVRSKT